MAESSRHLLLKRAAAHWARARGYRAAGDEVRLPNGNFRADVAACAMERPAAGEVVIARTAAFECKQSRTDFLSDALPEHGTRARLARLQRRKRRIEELVGLHYPNLREADSLFPEYRRADPSAIRHEGYRKVVREIRRLENGLGARTKFARMIRYRCVDLCYLVIAPGVAHPDEVPSAWGILEAEREPTSGKDAEPPPLTLVRIPAWNGARPAHRIELLFHLAAKASRPPRA